MDSIKFSLRGRRLWAALLVPALALALALPLGCTKKDEADSTAKKTEAPAEATQVEKADDPARQHFEKGVELSLKGEYEDAVAEYKKTIEYNPQSAEAYNNMGFAYFDMGEVDKAIEAQNKALEINPNLPNGYFGLALAYDAKGDEEAALENWKNFIQYAKPHSKWWMKAQERITAIEGGGEAAGGEAPAE